MSARGAWFLNLVLYLFFFFLNKLNAAYIEILIEFLFSIETARINNIYNLNEVFCRCILFVGVPNECCTNNNLLPTWK